MSNELEVCLGTGFLSNPTVSARWLPFMVILSWTSSTAWFCAFLHSVRFFYHLSSISFFSGLEYALPWAVRERRPGTAIPRRAESERTRWEQRMPAEMHAVDGSGRGGYCDCDWISRAYLRLTIRWTMEGKQGCFDLHFTFWIQNPLLSPFLVTNQIPPFIPNFMFMCKWKNNLRWRTFMPCTLFHHFIQEDGGSDQLFHYNQKLSIQVPYGPLVATKTLMKLLNTKTGIMPAERLELCEFLII